MWLWQQNSCLHFHWMCWTNSLSHISIMLIRFLLITNDETKWKLRCKFSVTPVACSEVVYYFYILYYIISVINGSQLCQVVDHPDLRRNKREKVRVIARKIRITRMKFGKVHFKGSGVFWLDVKPNGSFGYSRQYIFYPFKKVRMTF